jgi:hypothetical protein|tara:strand:+ start:347 stop:514 length:168 start_codon:yes stop_codon:yes gene_type:complete
MKVSIMDVVGYETETRSIESEMLGKHFKVTDIVIKHLDYEGNPQETEITMYLKED